MFGLFNSKKTEDAEHQILQALSPNVIAIVSASCCMPGAHGLDEQIKATAAQALSQAQLDWPVIFVTVTEAQTALPRVSGKLSTEAAATAAQVSELFVSSGLNAFPVLVANQRVVSFGGVPDVDLILKNLPRQEKATPHASVA